eukprot:4635115-Amphidinium_carterae.2
MLPTRVESFCCLFIHDEGTFDMKIRDPPRSWAFAFHFDHLKRVLAVPSEVVITALATFALAQDKQAHLG